MSDDPTVSEAADVKREIRDARKFTPRKR